MTLRLAVNRVVREQRAMEKKPGRLLCPQNPSTPTDPMGPESVINDDEEPPGRGQSIPRVRYGTIVPDRRLTMETAGRYSCPFPNLEYGDPSPWTLFTSFSKPGVWALVLLAEHLLDNYPFVFLSSSS